jgi:hypothetical protein
MFRFLSLCAAESLLRVGDFLVAIDRAGIQRGDLIKAIGGVEVEVRGNPVTVLEMRGARTILINAEGLWLRISIPRERE